MRNKINKKAELTTSQIITLIILLVSFAVLLVLFFRLDLGENTNKDICHNSVLLKDKSTVGGALDCRTTYVCISAGGKCENFNPTITKPVDLSEGNKEVYEAIADEMTDCWWMFGEGKINYISSYTGTHCAVCSVIKFDKSITGLTYDELYNFMQNNNLDETFSYLKYIYDVNSVDLVPNKQTGEIDASEKYSVITGRNKELINDDSVEPVYFIKSDEIGDKTECNVFDITKA